MPQVYVCSLPRVCAWPRIGTSLPIHSLAPCEGQPGFPGSRAAAGGMWVRGHPYPLQGMSARPALPLDRTHEISPPPGTACFGYAPGPVGSSRPSHTLPLATLWQLHSLRRTAALTLASPL